MLSSKWVRSGLTVAVVVIAVTVGYFYFLAPRNPAKVVPVTRLAQDVQLGNVKQIAVRGTALDVTYRDGTTATSTKATSDGSVEQVMTNLGVSPDRLTAVEIVYQTSNQLG